MGWIIIPPTPNPLGSLAYSFSPFSLLREWIRLENMLCPCNCRVRAKCTVGAFSLSVPHSGSCIVLTGMMINIHCPSTWRGNQKHSLPFYILCCLNYVQQEDRLCQEWSSAWTIVFLGINTWWICCCCLFCFLSWLVFLKHFPNLRKCVVEMSFDSC